MSNIPQEFKDQLNGWKFKRITSNCNHYIVYLDPERFTGSARTMTGADVTTQLRIPYLHRINKICFTHLTALDALGTDALNIEFGVKLSQHDTIGLFEDLLLAKNAAVTSRITEVFGEGYEYEARTWTLLLNSTNTDKIVPLLYIQIVGIGGYTN